MNVKQRQCLLVYLGYLDDDVDGIWGRNSKAACVDFQNDNGLDPDGICGPLTEAELKVCVANDKLKGQNKKPVEVRPAPSVPSTNPTTENASGELTWDSIKYFSPSEFACKCGGKYCDGCVDKVDLNMVKKLDEIREHFGVPITITSGVRCATHNRNVGGVTNSQHMQGKAADFIVKGVHSHDVYNYANSTVMKGEGGLGKYSNFTHLDTRSNYSRWVG